MSVGEYKTLQDSRRMETLLRQTQTVSKEEATRTEVYRLKEELQAAQQSVRMLEAEKESPYVKFFYATDDNRLLALKEYEKQLNEKIEEAKAKKAPNVMVLVTQRQYMECFIEYRLPIRKRRQDRPLTWVNDAELDKLTALNEAINNGETIETFRRRFHELTEKEKAAEREAENLGYMSENYAERLAAARAHLEEVRAELKEAAERLEMIEKIMNGTYVQDMLDKFSDRKRAEIVPNGYHQSGARRR